MALIFLGQTECALCGGLLIQGDEIVGLPAVSSISHPLYAYFDSGFHKSCFEKWDKKEEIEDILEKEKRSNQDTRRAE